MNKISGKISIFIASIIFVMLAVLFMKIPVDTETPVNTEPQVGGMSIKFEEGVTEPEVKAILENYNLTMYKLDYDVNDMADKYYITVGNNKTVDVRNELKAAPDINREGYYIISLSEQAIEDKSFLEMLNKNNLQLKKFVWCYIHFVDKSKYGIPEKDALRIRNDLEMNETVLKVFPEYYEG
jgi:hypothetical protein